MKSAVDILIKVGVEIGFILNSVNMLLAAVTQQREEAIYFAVFAAIFYTFKNKHR